MTTSHGSEARIKVSSSRSPRGSLCGAGWAWMMARACKQAGRLGAGRAPCAAAAFRLVRATSGEPSIEKGDGAIESESESDLFTGTIHGNTDCYLQFCAPRLP
jgi:hypothetical protein